MNILTVTIVLGAAVLSSSTIIKTPESGAIPPNFELLILHNNDMHARFEQTSQLSGTCTTADRAAGKCYGGFPRVAHVVKEARQKAASGEGPPVLYLNAGDTYTGTAWFTIYKWKIAAEFINALKPDAVSLGINDIETGSDQLSPFLNAIQTNILTSNVFLNNGNEKLQKSLIFDVNGVKVGIVGYLTPNNDIIENKNVEYINELLAVREEVNNLKAQGAKIVIALGHSKTNMDQEIAKEIEGVDLVINGYKNQYLWNGKSVTDELPVINNVATQRQQSGKEVPVYQSVAYDKYLGQLSVKFDVNGNVENVQINPILLDESIPQDPESVAIIQKFSNDIAARSTEIVGNTAVVLDGDSCVTEECNLGNLIADAMVYYNAMNFEGERWTDAPIAMIHSGAIADSIAPPNRPAAVTRGDLMAALPTESNVALVTSLGNHELDNGVSGLTPFVANLTCPVLAANLILTNEPTLQAEENLMKSVIFNINGTKVGVIGYLTPDTKVLAIRNDVEYTEETIAIKQEVARLKAENVTILIALGHSGFTKDLEIAKEVDGIDLVIGGHTNTFLWNGTTPDTETPQGPYPTLVKQRSGRLVPAVQAYAYTKYLGKLHLVFNSDGEIVSYDGNPILLNASVPQDPDVLAIVDRYRGEVMKISEVAVGNTSVVLDGHTCRLRECNLGNLITDAMVHKYASLYEGDGWTDAPIAIIQGGGIRASVAHIDLPAVVTTGDLLTVMPFDGNMAKVSVNGTIIWKMLEHSVAKYNTIRALGQFLQVSGIRVEYDYKYPPGKRVVKIYVRCGNCSTPMYSALNKSETYNILMPSFLSLGGDGFAMFDGRPASPLNYDELNATSEYIAKTSPVYPATEGRIVILNIANSASVISSSIGILISVLLFLLVQ